MRLVLGLFAGAALAAGSLAGSSSSAATVRAPAADRIGPAGAARAAHAHSVAPTCGPTAAPGQAPWPDFDGDAAHSGDGVGLAHPAGVLRRAWKKALDGAIYAQPLVAGGCLFVATENDSVYALNAATGAIRWHVHLGTAVSGGLPCGDISPSGITGAPALDAARGELWVGLLTSAGRSVAHELVGLNASNGRVLRTVRVAVPGREDAAEQQRSALVVANGNVYMALGGLYGDCNNYVGAVASVPELRGRPGYWTVPTAREAGIWEPGGPDVLANGSLLVDDGNGAGSPGQAFDGSNAMFNLSPALKVIGYFAPRDWAQLNQSDSDLGSTGPAVLPDGMALAVGKQGLGYLVNLSHMGGVGGQVATVDVCGGGGAFGADAVAGASVYVPCQNGLAKLQVSSRSAHVIWRSSGGGFGSPVVAGNLVWEETAGGQLQGLDIGTGKVVRSLDFASPVTHFPWLVAVDATLYAADGKSIVALNGL